MCACVYVFGNPTTLLKPSININVNDNVYYVIGLHTPFSFFFLKKEGIVLRNLSINTRTQYLFNRLHTTFITYYSDYILPNTTPPRYSPFTVLRYAWHYLHNPFFE